MFSLHNELLNTYGLISLWKIPFLCMWSIDLSTWYIRYRTRFSGRYCLLPFIASYIFMSINSKTRAKRPVGSSLHQSFINRSYYRTSWRVIMLGWGESLFRAWISLKLLTCQCLTIEIYLVDIIEVGLHALNGHILSGLDRLCLKDLRESTLALFADEPIFWRMRLVETYCAFFN